MLLDMHHVETSLANATVDMLCKSLETAMADDPHPTDPVTGAMEDATTLPIKRCLLGLYDAMLTLFVTRDSVFHKAASWWPVTETECQKLERRIMIGGQGSALTFTDYIDVIDCLLLRYLPPDVLREQVKALAVKQYLTGHLRTQSPEDPILAIATLPSTVARARALWHTIQPYELAVIEVAQANAARLVTDISALTRSRMKTIIIDAEKRRIMDGTETFAPAPLAQELADTFGDLNRDWRRIAITETAMNAADGFLSTMIGSFVEWLAHEGCCDACRQFNGRHFRVVRSTANDRDMNTDVWPGKTIVNIGRSAAKRKRLEDGTMTDRTADEMLVPAIPLHAHCLLPDQVVAAGSVGAVMKSLYEGRIIEFRTLDGRRLTVTENHPILTLSGFRLAKFLREGDEIVACRDSERMVASINPDDYQGPVRIEDLFASWQHSTSVVTASMPPTPEDFYGDGRFLHGEIHVVYANGLLRRHAEASIPQPIQQHQFTSCLSAGSLSATRSALKVSTTSPAAAHSSLGRHGIGAILLDSPISHHQAIRVKTSPWNDASFQQSLAKGSTTHSQFSRELILRFSSGIAIQDDNGKWRISNNSTTHITPDRIMKIRDSLYTGPVYDVTDEQYELYTGNDIIVKNCRCVWIPYLAKKGTA